VALLPTEIPGSREPGLRLNPQLGRILAKMRAELTSAEIAIWADRISFDDVLRDPRRYGIKNTTDKVRRPGAVRRRRDAVCTARVLGKPEVCRVISVDAKSPMHSPTTDSEPRGRIVGFASSWFRGNGPGLYLQ
jgi:hypothetical protein